MSNSQNSESKYFISKEDYQKWKEQYLEFTDIDTDYICYGDPNHRYIGHPDASVLFLNDL